jgi:hypothetical protein
LSAALLFLLLLPAMSLAAQVTLAWDPNDPAPDGYRVFQRTEGEAYDYSDPVWPGPEDDASLTTCTITDLAGDTLYYFVVRAFVGTEESGDSNEVSHRTEAAATQDHTITAAAGANGAISPSGEVVVTDGGDQQFVFSPNAGYHINDVRVDDQSMGALTSYTFSSVAADHTISVSFAPDTHTISATSGNGGSVSPQGDIAVTHGAGQTFTFSPDTGYHVADITVDGQSIGAASSYTFSNVTDDHTIAVAFTEDQYIISATAGTGGSISPQGEVTVSHGGGQSFTFSPDSGYHIANVTVDGQALGSIESYAFSNVAANHTIAVEFTATTYTIMASAGQGGSISPSGSITAALGGSREFDIVPDSGYVIEAVRVDGTTVGSPSTYRFENITADHVIEASFEQGNQAPVAEAGDNLSVQSEAQAVLDASGSSDPEGEALTYRWTQTNAPLATLQDPTAVRATITAPQVEAAVTLAFELTVTDPQGLSSSDTCLVRVDPPASKDTDGDGISDDEDNDDDNDGLPDEWELQYGFDPLTDDADGDPDGDGLSNYEEYSGGTDPLEADTNRSPGQPALLAPLEGETTDSLRVRFSATDFQDPDDGDTHLMTQWRIVRVSDQRVVLDRTCDRKNQLTDLRTPRLVLQEATTYQATVRYYDQDGAVSEWSDATTFATPGSATDTVKSATDSEDAYLIGASIRDDTESQVDAVEAVDPSELDTNPYSEDQTPYGLLAYRIEVAQPGNGATVTLRLSPAADADEVQWACYNSIDEWRDCTDSTTVNTDGETVERYIEDGGIYDADGTANGTIIEISGPVVSAASPDSSLTNADGTVSGQSGSSGISCFISSLF